VRGNGLRHSGLMTDVLLVIGVLQLASAALLGWLITANRSKPGSLERIGIRAPHRIMQLHLDQVMMGLIDLAVATAFPEIPNWVAIPLAIGTVLNPLGFVPLAFNPKLDQTLGFKAFVGFSFVASTIGFVGLAAWVIATI
jgi:hypothetical protein